MDVDQTNETTPAARRRRTAVVAVLAAVGAALATAIAVDVVQAPVLLAAAGDDESAREAAFAAVRRGRYVAGLVAGVAVAIAVVVAGSALRRYRERIDELVTRGAARESEGTERRLQSRSAVIHGLAKLAESRDDETGRHLDRIRAYVRFLAEALVGHHPEMTRELALTIVECSSLHDIGKVGVPDAVLLKPGPLTDAQREAIKRHTTIGGDTLLEVKRRWGDDPFLVTACEVAFAHHERWDGEGYPFGLEGDLIPISARVVALADVYDALTADRVYKDAMSHDSARELILEERGRHFDPAVVDAFCRAEPAFRRFEASLRAGVDPADVPLEGPLSMIRELRREAGPPAGTPAEVDVSVPGGVDNLPGPRTSAGARREAD